MDNGTSIAHTDTQTHDRRFPPPAVWSFQLVCDLKFPNVTSFGNRPQRDQQQRCDVQYLYLSSQRPLLVGGDWNMNFMFHFIYGMSSQPHWRTHIFRRGRTTTNQPEFLWKYDTSWALKVWWLPSFPFEDIQIAAMSPGGYTPFSHAHTHINIITGWLYQLLYIPFISHISLLFRERSRMSMVKANLTGYT